MVREEVAAPQIAGWSPVLPGDRAFGFELGQEGFRVLFLCRIFAFPGRGPILPRLGELSVELAPLLLGPPELLDGRGQVEEVHRNDVCPGAEVGVAYEGVELAASFDEALVDLPQPLALLGAVPVTVRGQGGLLILSVRGVPVW